MLSMSSLGKFFNKTVQSFRSFVSGCGCGNYHKLPKHTPSPYVHPQKSQDLDRFYKGFVEKWDSDSAQKRVDEMPASSSRPETRRSCGRGVVACKDDPVGSKGVRSRGEGSGRSRPVVIRKLKELEMMDLGNIEHVLDVEEVIHYYSLLTCPVYRGIVDEFFTEIYVEFSGGSPTMGAD